MRTIKQIHKAEYRPIDDLVTYSPLPSAAINHIDPFLFLNHHGPQNYPPNNHGLPFGPHPHRGMETVTFIIDGDISHRDSGGHESTINSGGIQWMTAGKGLIHAETSSKEFKKNGGHLEILQLWINLPAKLKMTDPKYTGLQKEQIPSILSEDKKLTMNLISGNWNGTKGAFNTLTDIFLCMLSFEPGAKFSAELPIDHNVFLYLVRGKVKINGTIADAMNLVEFYNDEKEIKMETDRDAMIIFGHAKPFGEPIVAYGPFVMNSEKEIEQAYSDYREGKFGTWNA